MAMNPLRVMAKDVPGMISRRFFIGGLASFAAVESRKIFATEVGKFSKDVPELTFGVLSDIHVSLMRGGRKLRDSYDTKHLEKAFAYFRDHGADVVLIAGDMAHDGVIGELKAVAKVWYRVFPNDRAPDGRKVERIFVFGNHDWSGIKRGVHVFDDEAIIRANALSTDPKRFWDECFHEEWKEFYTKEVKGFRFVGAHWCKGSGKYGDCTGKDESFIAGLADRYAALKGKIDPTRPFFHVQHPHPRGTVHGEGVWGQDDGESTKVLSAYPNAISFSGHSHTSLLDEKSIWQGDFTAVGTATLRNVGPEGIRCGLDAGYENYLTPDGNGGPLDVAKTMPIINSHESKQGQLVRVYGDRIVFERRDFTNDVALEDDFVMPLPAADPKPFAFVSRAAVAKAPRFADGATLDFRLTEAKSRGAKKGTLPKLCVEIAIPPANAEPAARCVRYEIVTTGKNGKELKIALLSEGFRFATSDKRVCAPAKCRIALDRLASGIVPFSVTAYSTWGKCSTPLKGEYDCGRNGDKPLLRGGLIR